MNQRPSTSPAAASAATAAAPAGRRGVGAWSDAFRGPVAALGLLAGVTPAGAATFTWDGGHNAQSTWSRQQNWNPNNNPPPSDGTADLIFAGDVRLDADAGAAFSLNSLRFDSSAGAFNLVGGTVTFVGTGGDALRNDDLDSQTLSFTQIVLGGTQTWHAAVGQLLVASAINLSTHGLTVTGAADTALTGTLTGSGTLTKSGSGTLTLSGVNSYTGSTTLTAGTLVASAAALPGAVVNHASLVFNQPVDATFSGGISGTGTLTKTGAGNLTLGAANTATGSTTVAAGTLTLGVTNALADTAAVSVATGATLALAAGPETIGSLSGAGTVALGSATLTSAGNAASTFAGTLTGPGTLAQTGAGTLTLTGSADASVNYTVTTGTLAGSTATLRGDIVNTGTVIFDQSAAGSYGALLTGSGTVRKSGAGSLTLTTPAAPGVATVEAATFALDSGDLVLAASNSLGDTTHLTLAAGTSAALAGGAETIGGFSGAGTIALGGHTLTSAGNASATFAGALTGPGTLTQAGSGTLTLAGTSDASVNFTVAAGTLAGSTASLRGSIANSGTVAFHQTSAGTYSGVISGAGSLTQTGPGTLTLAAAQTYTGGTTVAAGTLALGASDRLADSGDLTLGLSATLALGGASELVRDLAYTTSFLDYGAAGTANAFLFRDGLASTGTLTINQFNAGEGDVLAFNGTLATDFLAGVFFYGIGAGVLVANQTNVVVPGYGSGWRFITPDTTPFRTWDGGAGPGTPTFSDRFNWNGNQALNVNQTLKLEFNAASGSPAPVVDQVYNVNALRFAATADAFTLTAAGAGALTLTGNVASIIQLSAADQSIAVPLTLAGSTVIETSGAGDLTLGGVISGAGGFTKVGAGTAILAAPAANTYAGLTTVREGTLVVAASAALGTTTAGTVVDGGAVLALQNNVAVGAEALALAGTLRSTAGANVFAGPITGTGTIEVTGGSLTLAGPTANTHSGLTSVGPGATLTLGKSAGVTAVAGDLLLDGGTATLTASNQISDTSAVTLAGAAAFNLAGHTEAIGSLASASATASVTLGAGGALTVGAADTSTTFAGVVSGAGSLTKTGSGTLTLAGANTHAGATTVTGGTLLAAGDTALGSTAAGTTVAAGATLALQNNVTIGAESLALAGTLLSTAGTNTYGGPIAGGGLIAVTGGTLTLAGTTANTHSGLTSVGPGATLTLGKSAGVTAVAGDLLLDGGTATLTASNQISNTSAVTLAGAAAFNLAGHTETIGSLASASAAASVTLGPGGALTVGAADTSTTFAGVVSGAGSLTKTGAGSLTLTGANTYTGATTVTGGTLALGASQVLADTSALTLGYGSTLALAPGGFERVGTLSYSDATLGFGSGAGTFLFADAGSASGFLTITAWNAGEDVLGYLASSGDLAAAFLDNIFFSGLGVGIGAERSTGTVTFGGQNYYTLAPITTFLWDGAANSGPVARQDDWTQGANWGGNAPGLGDGKAVVFAGVAKTTTDMNGAFTINSLLFNSTAGAFTVNSSTGDSLSIRGGGLYNQSSATQTLNVGVNLRAHQAWNAQAGDLVVTGPIALDTFTLTVTGDADTSLTGAISGPGGLTKTGTGTLTLAGANTFTGATAVNAGLLAVTHADALGTAAASTTVASGATLRLSGDLTLATEALTLAGAGVNHVGALQSVSGANTVGGPVTLTADTTVGVTTGSLTLTGGVDLAGATLTTTGAGDLVVNAPLTSATGGALTLAGSGTVTLAAANTYAGPTSVQGGSLALAADNTLADTSVVTVGPAASLRLDAGFSDTIGGLLTGVDATVDLGAGATLTIVSTAANTLPGTLAGSGTLALDGGGSLALGADLVTAVTLDLAAGSLDLDGFDLTVGGLLTQSTSAFTVATDTTFTIDSAAANTLAGTLAGDGTLVFTGGGSLALAQDLTFDGTLEFAGGTLLLGGYDFTLGTLRITGDTLIDFGADAASFLHSSRLEIAPGVTLTAANWTDLVDLWTATNAPGLLPDSIGGGETGAAPLTQIVFNGFEANQPRWKPYQGEITPVPEPRTYGAVFTALLLAAVILRRPRRA